PRVALRRVVALTEACTERRRGGVALAESAGEGLGDVVALAEDRVERAGHGDDAGREEVVAPDRRLGGVAVARPEALAQQRVALGAIEVVLEEPATETERADSRGLAPLPLVFDEEPGGQRRDRRGPVRGDQAKPRAVI